jgi:hypothetical protein
MRKIGKLGKYLTQGFGPLARANSQIRQEICRPDRSPNSPTPAAEAQVQLLPITARALRASGASAAGAGAICGSDAQSACSEGHL